MKKIYEKPDAQIVEFESERIMDEEGGIGTNLSMTPGVNDGSTWPNP